MRHLAAVSMHPAQTVRNRIKRIGSWVHNPRESVRRMDKASAVTPRGLTTMRVATTANRDANARVVSSGKTRGLSLIQQAADNRSILGYREDADNEIRVGR